MTTSGSRSRLIQYVGKGGVGKTTIAAATAARAAALGHQTLVISTDPAHSLRDVVDQPLGAGLTRIGKSLFAEEINVLDEARATWGGLQERAAGLLRKAGIPEVQADELAILPGLDEVAALARIARACRGGDFDCVVVDSAPTGETIRLLGMPDSFQWYATRIQEWSQRLPRLLPALVRRAVPELAIVDALEQAKDQVHDVRELLSDAEFSSYRLVLTPDRMVLKEAERVETYLNLFGYPIDAVILNRVPPPAKGATGYWKQLAERQHAVAAEIEEAFGALPLFKSQLFAEEPRGVEALATLGSELFGERDPTDVLQVGATQHIEPSGDGYVLRILLPHLESERLVMKKRGDVLDITIGNVHREVPLPRTLAQLDPAGAKLNAGYLEIAFRGKSNRP